MGVCCQEIKEKESEKESEKEVKKKKKKKDKKNKENKGNKENKENKGNKDDNKAINKMSEEQTNVYLESLFKSYYSAKSYFNNNELKEKELDAINCCKKIIEAQDKLKAGKFKEINIDELPKKITPEYITGYTPEKKKEKINEIIEELNKERDETKKIMDNRIAEGKKNFNKMKDSDKDKLKQELSEYQNHIKSISKEIDTINKTLISDYTPIPLIKKINKPYKKEKFNLEIEENTMKIKVNGISYTKSNPIVVLGIKGDNININKEIKGKNKEEIYNEFIWQFNEEQYKNLIKNNLEIILGRTYTIKKTKVKGKGAIQLRKLKDKSYLDETIKLKMESGKSDTNIDIEIFLRCPFVDKEYEDDFREIISIEKIYPEFSFN